MDGRPNAVRLEARPSGRAPARHPSAAAQRREDARRQGAQRRDPRRRSRDRVKGAVRGARRAGPRGEGRRHPPERRRAPQVAADAARSTPRLGGAAVQTAGHVAKTTSKAQAAEGGQGRIAAGKANKAKGAQTAAGKARAALSKTARAEAAASVDGTTAAATTATGAREGCGEAEGRFQGGPEGDGRQDRDREEGTGEEDGREGLILLAARPNAPATPGRFQFRLEPGATRDDGWPRLRAEDPVERARRRARRPIVRTRTVPAPDSCWPQ